MLDRIVKGGYAFVKSSYSPSLLAPEAPATIDDMGNAQGARIKARREAEKMNRQALADAVGVSRQSVIKWEDSKEPVEISRGNLRELARALKCTESYILHGGSLEGPRAPKGLDGALLQDCLSAFQEATEGRQVPPKRATEIIGELYEMWDGSGTKPPKDVLLRFIRRRLMEG